MIIWLFLLLFYINHGLAAATYYHCYSTSNFTSGSAYGSNRDGFLESMPSEIRRQDGFSYTQSVTYTSTSNILYCIGLCRADLIASDACSICISDSSSTILNNCPVQMEVIAWGEDAGCVVRCAPHVFPSLSESQPTQHTCNSSNVTANHLPQLARALANLTNNVAAKTAADGSKYFFATDGGDMPKYFATIESNLSDLGLTIYALGFCLPTLSPNACSSCLRAAAKQSEKLCSGKKGATIFTPSCVLRYELYRFYKSYSLLPSLPSSPPPASPQASNVRKESHHRGTYVITIVLPIVGLIVIALVACNIRYVIKKRKQNKDNKGDDTAGEDSIEPSLEYSFNVIRIATNNFSTDNKLGQGGFGAVYKGRLPNGQKIAVKRLVAHTGRRDDEFKNEVQLVARLHHRNLVRLLGFCLQGSERILIYELAHNGSLDHFLFDQVRKEHLTWEIRYKIIEGIARGMLYLHEESQLRIIHRDLKAGNILLDESFTPKISDFGTAKLFVEDHSRTSKIVGTYGYIAPEYFKYGKISVKVDAFSFGVLLLEIVSGKKNSAFDNPNHIEHQLSKAWTYWTEGAPTRLIDPILLRASGHIDDIIRCMHIGLLCVQENAADRPTMNSILLMLGTEDCSQSQSLPPPLKPAYYMDTSTGDDEPNFGHRSESYKSQQTSGFPVPSSDWSSANEVSITQPYPEPR